MNIEKLNELFKVNVDNEKIDITKSELLVLCKDNDDSDGWDNNHPVLLKVDEKIFNQSSVCGKRVKILSKSDIEEIRKGLETDVELQELQTVMIFEEPKYYFLDGFIQTIDDFNNYILFANKYMLNIRYICSKIESIVWLLSIRENQKIMWKNNSVILTNIEQKLFDRKKFVALSSSSTSSTSTSTNTSNISYPVANSNNVPVDQKYMCIKNIESVDFLSHDEFKSLVEILLDAGAVSFVSKLVAIIGSSLEHYHNIIGNGDLIGKIYEMEPFESCVFYAMRIMYLEELSMYHRKRGKGRFILDINAANQLPDFPQSNIKHSPYMATKIKCVNFESGLSLPMMISGKRGIYPLNVFLDRFDKYTFGILKNIKWSSDRHKSAVSGSTITACAIQNPFEVFFRNVNHYFDEYYPSKQSKRQIISKKSEDTEQIESITDEIDDEVVDDDELIDIRIEEIKDQKQKEKENDDSDDDHEDENGIIHKIEYSDIDLMIECKWDVFDEIADEHFQNIRYTALCNGFSDSIQMVKVVTENKHKFVITGLPRDIDIFHIDDIPSVIVKYHLGCVRAWYDGNNVWCFPSFITAAKLGVNMDIRWTSNRKDVRDIILKYFQRGYSTLINENDKKNIIEYINRSKLWPSLKPPNPNHGWRTRRFWRMPLFYKIKNKMFNPSHSRYGIHRYLDTEKQPLRVSITCEDRRRRRRTYWRDTPNFIVNNGIVLPTECYEIYKHL